MQTSAKPHNGLLNGVEIADHAEVVEMDTVPYEPVKIHLHTRVQPEMNRPRLLRYPLR